MLTKDEALRFINEKLAIGRSSTDVEALFKEDKLTLLNNLIKQFHFNIPFQNIDLLALPSGTQDIPTIAQIKSGLLNGRGGLCYANNVSFFHILKALGYKAYFIASTVTLSFPDDHIVIVVYDLVSTTDKYLVDVGCGYPTYKAINLSFENESQIYKSGFLTYKFVRASQDTFERYHLQDFHVGVEPSDNKIKESSWKRYYSLNTSPRELESFNSAMSEVYKDLFLTKFRFLIFSESSMKFVKNEKSGLIVGELKSNKDSVFAYKEDISEIKDHIFEMTNIFDENILKLSYNNFKGLLLEQNST